MIAWLEGEVLQCVRNQWVIVVNHMGYRVYVPTLVDHTHQMVKLHITHVIRENINNLYGFFESSTQRLFERLIIIPGIGAKLALEWMTADAIQQFSHHVATKNSKALQQYPKLGKKIAEKILLELSDWQDVTPEPTMQEALDVLCHLGFSISEAGHALQQLPLTLSLNDRICQALALLKK
jgi:holliday junction DNA helicase RuvA